MRQRHEIDTELVKSLLDYEPDTGVFRWREARGRGAPKGGVAGTKNVDGYLLIKINGTRYMAHRLAWAVTTGARIEAEIDHINGDRVDNRIANLREATRIDNSRNKSILVANTSGVCGICWVSSRKKWMAYITVDNKMKNLGLYRDIEDARSVRLAAAQRYGFDPMHGCLASERLERTLG